MSCNHVAILVDTCTSGWLLSFGYVKIPSICGTFVNSSDCLDATNRRILLGYQLFAIPKELLENNIGKIDIQPLLINSGLSPKNSN